MLQNIPYHIMTELKSPHIPVLTYIECTPPPPRASAQECPFRLSPISQHTAEDSSLPLMSVSGQLFLKKTRRGEANRHMKRDFMVKISLYNRIMPTPGAPFSLCKVQIWGYFCTDKGSLTFAVCKCPWFLEKKKVSKLFFHVHFYLFWIKYFMIVAFVFHFLNAKGSKSWVQTISFTMKRIEIRKSFIEYCPP